MNEQEKHTQPNTYECVYPGSRFTEIADHILDIYGTDDDYTSSSALWFNNDGYDEYRLKRYHRHGSEKTIYQLHHYDKRHSEPSETHYTVFIVGDATSNVMLLNDEKMVIPLDSAIQRNISREVLEILSEKAPEAAEEARDNAFDRKFNRVAAKIVLSDFADEDDGRVFNPETLDKAVGAFQKWIGTVVTEEMRIAAEKKEHLQQSDKVYGATILPPSLDEDNRFVEVPLLETAYAVAEEMDYKWPYDVSMQTDHQENERYMEKRGEQ